MGLRRPQLIRAIYAQCRRLGALYATIAHASPFDSPTVQPEGSCNFCLYASHAHRASGASVEDLSSTLAAILPILYCMPVPRKCPCTAVHHLCRIFVVLSARACGTESRSRKK